MWNGCQFVIEFTGTTLHSKIEWGDLASIQVSKYRVDGVEELSGDTMVSTSRSWSFFREQKISPAITFLGR